MREKIKKKKGKKKGWRGPDAAGSMENNDNNVF